MTMTRHSAFRIALLALLAACGEYGPVAPDGARLVLHAFADTIPAGVDSTLIAATVYLESGDVVGYDANVVLSTTLGGLCKLKQGVSDCDGGGSIGLPTVKTLTREGVAVAVLHRDGRFGSTTLRAASGDAKDSLVVFFDSLP